MGDQCGGSGYSGPTNCCDAPGATCMNGGDYWSSWQPTSSEHEEHDEQPKGDRFSVKDLPLSERLDRRLLPPSPRAYECVSRCQLIPISILVTTEEKTTTAEGCSKLWSWTIHFAYKYLCV